MKNKFALAVVLPRYGNGLGGGAETLLKSLVDNIMINSPDLITKIEVWTTCALDHRTWENHFPAGDEMVDGVLVKRFPVDPRDLELFIKAEIAMQEGRTLTIEDQINWLANSVNSTALYRHIAEHGQEFDLMFFTPYLFAISFWGALIYPERSIMIPCLHNEHYAYQKVFKYLFSKVRGLMFHTNAERELACEIYQDPFIQSKSAVVGMGFKESEKDLSLTSLFPGEDYLLYSGRKEKGKNLDLVIDYFEHYKKVNIKSQLKLVLVGSGEIAFRDQLPEGVVDLGFVSEQDKLCLMRNCLALCQPSVNESFSIVIMEAWLEAVPVLVHANCAVTREHVVRSGGGLYFSGLAEFCSVVDYLRQNRDQRQQMGAAGKNYVQNEYSWEAVKERFFLALSIFSGEDLLLEEVI